MWGLSGGKEGDVGKEEGEGAKRALSRRTISSYEIYAV
jgi:hypothetical protein